MDEFGIAVQVISTGSPGIQGYADARLPSSRQSRSMMHRRRSSGSIPAALRALAGLPTQDPKAAADELERSVKPTWIQGRDDTGQHGWSTRRIEVLGDLERAEASVCPSICTSRSLRLILQKYMQDTRTDRGHVGLGVEAGTHALRIITPGSSTHSQGDIDSGTPW